MVPGKLESVDHVFVSVGAGYVVEKKVEDAREFFKEKTRISEPSLKAMRNEAMGVEEQLAISQRVASGKEL